MTEKTTSRDGAREAWGDNIPDWVEILAEECDRTSQARTGRAVGYSNGAINAVLKNTYKGDVGSVEEAVRGKLMAKSVECPVDGEITTNICIKSQRQPLLATSNRRVRLFRACRGGCAHSRVGR